MGNDFDLHGRIADVWSKETAEIGSSLGKGIREFKSSVREIETELKNPDRQIHKATYPPGETEDEEDQADEDDSASDDGPRSLSDD